MMSLVLIQQLTLISHNLTLVEWRRAAARGFAHRSIPLVVSAKYNVNDRGLLQNWKDFLANRRRQRYIAIKLPR